MSRTIKTNSGSEFITNISNEEFIGVLCKEVDAKHDSDFVGPTMAYDMTEEEANDAAYKLNDFLSRERYFRFFEKVVMSRKNNI